MIYLFSFCLLFIITIGIIYFSKERINNIDNKLYSSILITNIIGVSIDILQFFSIKYNFPEIVRLIISKIFLIYILTWSCIFTLYVLSIRRKKGSFSFKNKSSIYTISIYFAFFVLAIFFPIKYYSSSNGMYTYGIGVSSIFIAVLVFISIMFVSICIYFFTNKKASKKKYIPVFMFLILGVFGSIFQTIDPTLLFTTPIETFVTILTYFFIENPDIKMIEELELAKNQADQANNAKTDFLSSMSHEIRTPLNAIVGFSECIKQSDDINEVHQDAEDVIKASQTLLEIVNGILDISKIESGKLEIVNSNYKAKEVFNDIARLFVSKMDEKALDFQISIAEDIPENLYGDYNNLKKVITNILSNASKYTENGYVKYEVRCINNKKISRLIISVEDSGRGIKKENIDKLFTKFQRLEEDKNTTLEGTGLGLAITKQLVELMGGKVIVQSVYGSGSKFTIILDQRIEYVEEVVSTNENSESNNKVDISGKKILIVDDNVLNIKVASKLLAKYNLDIATSESGIDTIEKIKNGNVYDLILLDDMMPKLSGVETFKQLKNDYNINIPIVALTANAINGMKEKYLDIGFDDYLAKPINKDELDEVVFKYLGKNEKSEKIDFGELPKDFYEVGNFEETK